MALLKDDFRVYGDADTNARVKAKYNILACYLWHLTMG